jgi:hypothetical protein
MTARSSSIPAGADCVSPALGGSGEKRVAKLARGSSFRGVGFVQAGPAANNSGPRAVLRRHAPSATRQRTLEANGIDCGASVLRRRLTPRAERLRARLSAQASLARIVRSACSLMRSKPRTRSGDSAHSFLSRPNSRSTEARRRYWAVKRGVSRGMSGCRRSALIQTDAGLQSRWRNATWSPCAHGRLPRRSKCRARMSAGHVCRA